MGSRMPAAKRRTLGRAWLLLAACHFPQLEGVDCPGCVPVFYDGLQGMRCFRIPTIIKTHAGTLLAFAENRLGDCGDQSTHILVVRRSSDLGRSWGPVIEVAVNLRAPCAGCPAAISNPNPLEVDFKNGSYAILLTYDTMNNPNPDQHGVDMMIWSYDDGATWGEPDVISFPPTENTGGLVGPSAGIQSQKGTLIFSAGHVDCCRFLFFSRDFGATWQSTLQQPGTDGEGTIVFLNNHEDPEDETVLINMRQDGKNHRMQRTWTWAGSGGEGAWSEDSWPAGLIDGDVQGSMINHQGTLYLSNIPQENSERAGLTIKRSLDKGSTWEQVLVVWTGPSAYSQLVPLSEDSIGILFEGGMKFPYENIYFTAVSLGGSIFA